jgi:hypothetical protein
MLATMIKNKGVNKKNKDAKNILTILKKSKTTLQLILKKP